MTQELKEKLIYLANRYEIPSFMQADPSQFLLHYENNIDLEPACFFAAMLSFGSREQFIPKIRQIFNLADKSGGMANWLKTGEFQKEFDEKNENFIKNHQKYGKFYRFYSFSDMNSLFLEMAEILKNNKTFGDFLKNQYQKTGKPLYQIISETFVNSKIVPKGKTSANKRIHMYLRWMVRQNSAVDLGAWNWYPQSKLLIPLDVHVMQEAVSLGLLQENASASYKTAVLLTEQLNQVFPEDPCRGDFALFGLGVDKNI